MDFERACQTILDEVKAVLNQVDSISVDSLIDAIGNAQGVFVTGEGRSGLISRCFAMRLMHLGITSYVVGGTTTPAFKKHNLLIALSGSGRTELTYTVAKRAASAGGKVAILTAEGDSPLAQIADVVVLVPTKTTAFQSAQYGRSLFEQCALLLLDGIAVMLQQELGLNLKDMDARHANLE